MLTFVGKTCCKWTILSLKPVEILRSSFCGIFGQIHSPGVAANHWNVGPRFALQCTTTSTVALKLKDLGFMLTGKLLFKFSLYI